MCTTHPFRRMVTDNKKLFRQRKILLSTERGSPMSKESAVPTDLKLHAGEVVHKVIRPVKNGF